MARKVLTTVEVTDDLDGSKADRTVEFSWNGVRYEIDLSKRNASAFEKAIAPYVSAARKVRFAGRRKTARPGASGKRTDLAEIRAWAQQNGFEVADRGRIPNSVIDAYDAR